MKPNSRLQTYSITFPKDPHLQLGIGVTAFSGADAFALIEEQSFNNSYENASEILATVGVQIQDIDQGHVVPNMGPMQLRGVWHPVANIGYGK